MIGLRSSQTQQGHPGRESVGTTTKVLNTNSNCNSRFVFFSLCCACMYVCMSMWWPDSITTQIDSNKLSHKHNQMPVTYPSTAPEIQLPELEGKTSKMYRGGKICLTIHFNPLWSRNVPRFGIAHALALGVSLSLSLSLSLNISLVLITTRNNNNYYHYYSSVHG